MNKEINTIIANLEGCSGIFDYLLTPIESDLLVSYIEELQQENKQLKEQLLVTQTNEETFRLEMGAITQALGLDENTLFDDVKTYVRILKDNWNELKEFIVKEYYMYLPLEASTKSITILIDKMAELEQGNLIEK